MASVATPLLLVALLSLASPSEAIAGDLLRGQIAVFRVFPIFESEGSRRVAKSELGCDPCEEVVHEDRDGSDAKYLLNPDDGVYLSSEAVETVDVDATEEGAVVFVTLTERGKSLIESLVTAADDSAANFVGGEIIDVVPLRTFGARYVVAFAPTALDAEQIVQRLRKEVPRSPQPP